MDMSSATLPQQSPEFVAAIHAYCAAHRAGERDMDTLGPLVDHAFSIFNWSPRPPVKPLTTREVNRTVKKWMALPKEQGDRLEQVFNQIRDMPEDESTKLLDFWAAAIDAIKTAE
jgi:hypothetical protein